MKPPFEVALSNQGEKSLSNIWIFSKYRDEILRDDSVASQVLSRTPETSGSHLSEELYVLRLKHLKYFYSIDHSTSTVTILNVALAGRFDDLI
jgi:hypothetical protein